MPLAAIWIQLEIMILSEVSQKGEDKYHILTHIMESRKIVLMILYRAAEETQP